MADIKFFSSKKMYDPSLTRFNLQHIMTLRRYLYNKVDFYSVDALMRRYSIQIPALGYYIIKDQKLNENEKINYMLDYLLNKSNIAIMIGDAGQGKSAKAHWLFQELHRKDKGRPLCSIRHDDPPEYPPYIICIDEVEQAPPNSIILYDEAVQDLSSRSSMTKEARMNTLMMCHRRHRGLSIIYVTQHSYILDLNVLRMATCLFFKRLTWEEMVRTQESHKRERAIDFLMKFADAMEPVSVNDNLFWDGREKWLTYSNPLPDFWTEDLSMGYSRIDKIKAVDIIQSMYKRHIKYGGKFEIKRVQSYLGSRGIEFSPEDVRTAMKNPSEFKRNLRTAMKVRADED